MKKLLAILYLIFSYSLCKECIQDECQGLPAGENQSNYACVPIDDNECEFKLLCSYATKADGEATIQCSDYPTIHPDKICINSGETCSEEYKCKTVPSIDLGKTCSSYEVSDIAKYVCKEKKVEEGEEVNICSKYALSGSSIKAHTCIEAEEEPSLPCEEIPFCS